MATGGATAVGAFDHLSGGRLDLSKVRKIATNRIAKALSGLEGRKCLIWDPAVLSKMNLVLEAAFLKDMGVDKMNQLPNVDAKHPADYFVYIVGPERHVLELVAESAKQLRVLNRDRSIQVVLLFIPRRLKISDTVLLRPELVSTFHIISDLGFYLFPLESDLLTLTESSAFTDLYVDRDPSPLYNVARSLMDVQAVFGPIPKIVGKGHCAQRVAEIVDQMREQLYPDGRIPGDSVPQLSSVVLVDRSVDLLTPLFTQLTLEGLVDQLYGIENGLAVFPAETFSDEVKKTLGNLYNEQRGECKIRLSGKDDLYTRLRDLHIQEIGPFVKRELAELQEYFQMNPRVMSIPEMKEYAQELPYRMQAKQQLSKFSTIGVLVRKCTQDEQFMDMIFAEQDLRVGDGGDRPMPYIESCIGRKDPLSKVLRLICIQSLSNGGLKSKLLELYEKEILQVYGYEYLPVLISLRKAGLLSLQEGKTHQAVRRQFRLLVEPTGGMEPEDISYAYSGYAPLSVRLVEMLSRSHGVVENAELLKLLPGPTVEKAQPIPKGLVKNKARSDEKPVVLVYFIGGCTYAEVAALRFLASRREEVDYIIATTHMINGQDLMKSILSRAPKNEHQSQAATLQKLVPAKARGTSARRLTKK